MHIQVHYVLGSANSSKVSIQLLCGGKQFIDLLYIQFTLAISNCATVENGIHVLVLFGWPRLHVIFCLFTTTPKFTRSLKLVY